jgi:HK97 family phage major capsid protein
MQAGLDPSYLAGAKYYMNRTQYAGLLSLTDSEGRSQYEPSSGRQMLLNLPLVVTNAVTDLTASTVSGPVLMNGKAAFTQRIVDDPNEVLFLRSLENRAEYAEVLYRSGLRVDFQPRDTRGVVGVAAQAS